MTSVRSLTLAGVFGLATSVASAAPGPGIILNEYLYDPATTAAGDANKDTIVDTSQDEFVEMVNTSAVAIDMTAWKLFDATANARHIFPVGTVLGPGCAIVVFGGGHPPINLFGGAIVQVASTGLLGLNNNGDTITLKDAGDNIVFTYTYSDAGNVDESYTRDPDITGATFVKHSLAVGSGGTLFSPGVRVTGAAFGACVPPGPDADGDGHPDDVDNCPSIANPSQEDCDGNGIGDVCDIAGNPGLDANQNGILDSCEPDCNMTGLPDDLDILLGISLDCNLNGIPDECEVASGHDCNGNQIPDDCDIANHTSQDVNLNGIPDECESSVNVVINEVMAAPNGDTNGDTSFNSVQDEFIEIVNASAASVNISGWTISDALTVRHVFPNGTILPANCGIVVWGGGTPIGQFGGMQKQVASVSPVNGLALNNDGDTVTLRDTSSLLVDSMSYTATTSGVSITRSPDLTGGFVLHTTAQAGVNFSPGKRVNLTTFGGCPPELLDSDNDGIPDVNDNCDFVANPFQQDCDNDGIGDACETDPDSNGNGIPDNCEIGVPGNVRINEIRIDETGTDNDEYFEIKGPANLSLNGLTLIVIGDGVAAAGSGVIEQVTSLNGKTIPADGHFLCAESTMTLVPLAQVDFVTTLNFENQDNVTFALVTNFNGLNGQDLDTNNDGVLDVRPWGAVVDAVGILASPLPPSGSGVEWAYGTDLLASGVNVGPDPNAFDPGQIYRCETTGTWLFGNFNPVTVPVTDTPGHPNLACPAGACVGDANTNGVVDIDDLVLVITHWGNCVGCTPPGSCIGDVNHNCVVNIDDLVQVITHWGNCPVAIK